MLKINLYLRGQNETSSTECWWTFEDIKGLNGSISAQAMNLDAEEVDLKSRTLKKPYGMNLVLYVSLMHSIKYQLSPKSPICN